jgi:hypothetical protein
MCRYDETWFVLRAPARVKSMRFRFDEEARPCRNADRRGDGTCGTTASGTSSSLGRAASLNMGLSNR